MFEEKDKLEPQSSQTPNAFIQGLPSFSLPTNLNSKLAANKKNGPQLSRPRLSSLRSTWLSRQTIEEDTFAQDKLIEINLPPLTTTSSSSQPLENETEYLNLIANSLCLTTSFDFYAGHNNTIVISRKCIIVYLASTTSSVGLIKLDESLQRNDKQQQEDYQAKSQHAIDEALSRYYDRRQLFLSTVSQEIRDASLMVLATLEQFSPPSILTNTHELLSACSIAVPIASISAISTTIKQACHISSHLNLVSKMLRESDTNNNNTLSDQDKIKSTVKHDFDVSELIQNVGDSLAGMSAKLGVHFVIYHTDNGLYYSNVIGDEDAIKHALINLLRNILEGCTPGACIELGLYVSHIPETPKIKVVFDIIQTASPAIPIGVSAAVIPNANFTAQLLSYIGGEMKLEDLGKNQTRVEISLELLPGCNSDQRLLLIEKPSQILEKQLSNIRFSNEPTLEDLTGFIAQLKGVKMILHGPEKSIFAKHLTSCLTSWNTDISHVPVLSYADDDYDSSSTNAASTSYDSEASSSTVVTDNTIHSVFSPASNRSINSTSTNITGSKVPSPAIEEDHIHSIPPTFILIDDDVLTLEKKLREFRDQPQITPAVLQHQHRRHRRSKSRNNGDVLHGTIAVVFFTSLTNYRRVRDIIHWISTLNLPPYMPRVVVVPKPAGPRRFLTALHTAWNNAIVEPQFIPIATSPLSPFVSQHQHLSPGLQDLGSNGTVTPGGGSGGGGGGGNGPLMTPHDPNARYSPGRRAVMTGMRVHSPSGLAMESEKGNYFFDPNSNATINRPTNNNTAPVQLNLSPLLAGPTSIPPQTTNNGGLHTPGNGGGNGGITLVPQEMKRRLRSHSNSFITPNSSTRRNMVDLAQPSSPKKPTPVQEEEEDISSSNTSSMDSTTLPLAGSSMDSSTSTNASLGSTRSIPTSVPPLAAPAPFAAAAADAVVADAKAKVLEATEANAASATTATTTTATPVPAVVVPTTKPKSKFSFRISNRKRKERSNAPDKPSPPIKVLIVEDNMINQAILSTWMKKHSIKFSVACDGKEAVEKWEGGGFHLILMDIQLPVMNGIDATKTIRAIEKERKIGVLPTNSIRKDVSTNLTSVDTKSSSFQSPVIIVALTASSLESDRQAALAAGCNDFLTKPVSLEWLEKKIIEWGCMQALIDFEGWRKWKRSTDGSPTTAAASASVALKSKLRKEAALANSTASLKEVNTLEKENLALRTKELLKDESRAIVLVGINKRRMSTLQDRSQAPPIISTTVPQKLRRKGSDSNLKAYKLSIPVQLEQREHRRLLEERLSDDDDSNNNNNDSE
ncbi:hypothetical protein HPULCUR_011131 [Helicostylum pulchrum]|uniref:Response regulatory domain-containing protein n=1 Tax=Helicostylum pulchrum TaxID=562976 RepID=A0ABP9YFA8_9FUNG